MSDIVIHWKGSGKLELDDVCPDIIYALLHQPYHEWTEIITPKGKMHIRKSSIRIKHAILTALSED